MSQRIGILGGSFDPIHYGHLAAAETARMELRLDRVLFVPAARQPLKHGSHGALPAQRLAMTTLACADNPAFEVSAIELERPGPSYSVVTLEALHRQHPGEYYFVLGADAASDLGRWYAADRIIELAHITVIDRPGISLQRERLIERFPQIADRMLVIEGPRLDISSTHLRQRVALGQSIRYFTPDPVVEYIISQRLYQADQQVE